jgi:signal peptide peptidase SppA
MTAPALEDTARADVDTDAETPLDDDAQTDDEQEDGDSPTSSSADVDQVGEIAPIAALPTRSYRHVTKAIFERAWAVQEQYLTFMADMVHFRIAGGLLSEDEITKRLAAAAAENGDRSGAAKAGSIAIIPMYGVLSQRQSLMSDMSGGTSLAELRSDLREALNDPSVKAIVFDIDSPGGSVDGVTEFAAELRQARAGDGAKPIVAQINTLCASAAYWLASCCSEIVMTPSGECGSIGVYAAHHDESGAQAQAGIKTTLISAGPFKVDGNSYEPLTDTARTAMQEAVDTFYSMFVSDVAKGRNTSVDAVAQGYGEGRTMQAKQALAAGMVDRIDTLDATVQRLANQRLAAPLRPAARAALLPIQPAAVAAPLAATAAPSAPDRAWNKRMKGRNR